MFEGLEFWVKCLGLQGLLRGFRGSIGFEAPLRASSRVLHWVVYFYGKYYT